MRKNPVRPVRSKARAPSKRKMEPLDKEFKKAQKYIYVIAKKTGKKVKRIKFGFNYMDKGHKTCPDCGIPRGYYHYLGCDWEADPTDGTKKHGGQLLTSNTAGDFSR